MPGVVLVTYRPGTSKVDRTSARRFVHATRGEALSPLSGAAEKVTLPSVVSVDAAITALEGRPEVRSAEPDYVLRTDATSNDPLLTEDDGHGPMWGLLSGSSSPANTYGSGAVGAWAQGVTGSHNIVVGVVDEGIQVDHPDLAANIWTNPWDPPNGLDDDGNGYVDDVHGWDFKHNDNSVYDGPATDDHATHVAGTIGAVGGNGTGVVGVNWNVTLISAKFLEGTGDTADAIRAIDYLTDLKVRHGLNIVASNNSWGGGGSSQALTDAINRGGDQGILFVAAGGNDGVSDDGGGAFFPAAGKCDRHYPSGASRGWDCIVSVAAITKTGALASYSNFGAVSVDLGAPGSDILSTYPPSQYAWIDGTSMAAPHVTGALALLASCSFGLTPSQLRADLLAAATTTPSLAGKTSTGKRLNIAGLISAYCSPSGPPTAIVTGPSGIGVGSSFDETVWFSHAVTGLAAGDFNVGGTSGGWACQRRHRQRRRAIHRVPLLGRADRGHGHADPGREQRQRRHLDGSGRRDRGSRGPHRPDRPTRRRHPAGDADEGPDAHRDALVRRGDHGPHRRRPVGHGDRQRLLDRRPDRWARQQVLHRPGQRLRRGNRGPDPRGGLDQRPVGERRPGRAGRLRRRDDRPHAGRRDPGTARHPDGRGDAALDPVLRRSGPELVPLGRRLRPRRHGDRLRRRTARPRPARRPTRSGSAAAAAGR